MNGTGDEAAFGPFLAALLAGLPSGGRLDIQSVPADGDPLGRPLVIARLRGTGTPQAVVVMGHYDTVGTSDFGEHEPIARDPEALGRLYASHPDPSVRKDATDGRHLFGRGVLDMKSGLAAMVAVLEALCELPPLAGDVLFAFCPDEEADSRGARTLRRLLCREEEAGSHLIGCINTDYGSPDAKGRHVAFLGSVGKVLPALFIGGTPTHATEPDGLTEPAHLLAAVVQDLTFHPDLTDRTLGQVGPPPVPLSLADSRTAYDVQTLSHAFAYFNVITLSRTPSAVLGTFCRLVEGALDRAWEEGSERLRRSGHQPGARPTLLRWEELAAKVEAEAPGALQAILRKAAAEGDPRRRSQFVVERAWRRIGAPPMAVAYFAQDAIPRVGGDGGDLIGALRRAAVGLLAEPLEEVSFFPAISDMSFVTRSPDEGDRAAFLADYPGALASSSPVPAPAMPVVNLGPEGKDAHRPSERVETDWTFGRLPHLILATVRDLLS